MKCHSTFLENNAKEELKLPNGKKEETLVEEHSTYSCILFLHQPTRSRNAKPNSHSHQYE